MYNLREKKSKISFRSEVVIDYSFGEERIRDDKRFKKTTELDLNWKLKSHSVGFPRKDETKLKKKNTLLEKFKSF